MLHRNDIRSDLTDEQAKTYEEEILQMLKKYKIGENVDINIFEPYVGKNIIRLISKITRVSETSFKIKGKSLLGVSAIDESASISVEKNSSLVSPYNKNCIVKGVKVTLFDIPNIKLTYTNAVHKIDQFIMSGNNISYIYNKRLYTYDFNKFK